MNSEFRVSATKYIWVAFFLGLLVTSANVIFYGQTPGLENVIMTIVLAIAATGSSVAVWASLNSSSSQDEKGETKLKRGERVKRLIDLIDEDELYALRQRLSQDYAEPPADFVMLGDDGELHRRQMVN